MHARFLMLLGALFFVMQARGEFVDLTADIEIVSWGTGLRADPPIFESRVWKTRCVVGTNSWLISAYDEKAFPTTWFYNGSNLVCRIPDPPEKSSPGATNYNLRTRTLEFKAGLENDAGLPPVFRAAWLAFCSGSFFKQPQRRTPLLSFWWKESWLNFDYAAEPVGFQNKVVQFEDDLGLPISVDVLSKSGHPLLQYRLKYDHPSSPSATNVASWDFPRVFRAVQYFPVHGAKDKWEADFTVNGRLTSIKVGSPPELPRASAQSSRRLETNELYVLKASGCFNVMTNSPELNKARIVLRKRQQIPYRIEFTITNDESEEILLWNVRVQAKSYAECGGTDGFGWDTVFDDYPDSGDAALKPGRSTTITVAPSAAPLWRVCVLYSKEPTEKSDRKVYAGNYEIISDPIDAAMLEKIENER